jgi:hypothetical protein
MVVGSALFRTGASIADAAARLRQSVARVKS